ncbi:MAG: hypothetical protein KC503_24600 [Myxococcales bacterium]|nr:hypothetical protein [Myxococcales bacterium]
MRTSFLGQHAPNRYSVALKGFEARPRDKEVCPANGSQHDFIYAALRSVYSKAQAGSAPKKLHRPSVTFLVYHYLRERAHEVLNSYVKLEHRRFNVAFPKGELAETPPVSAGLSLIDKHGIVPEGAMPEAYEARITRGKRNDLQAQLDATMAEFVKAIEHVHDHKKPDSAAAKTQRTEIVARYKKRVDALLDKTLGKPPKAFRIGETRYTPKSYAQEVLGQPSKPERVVLTNDPNRPMYRRFKRDGVVHYNVPLALIRRAVVASLKVGEAVPMTTDLSARNAYQLVSGEAPQQAVGVLSLAAFDYSPLVGESNTDKAQMRRANTAAADHTLAITGYDAKGGKVVKWRVEGALTEKMGDKGVLHMYDDYLGRYIDSAVVSRDVVSSKLLQRIDKTKLLPWEPSLKERYSGQRGLQNLVFDVASGKVSERQAARHSELSVQQIKSLRKTALNAMWRALDDSDHVRPADKVPQR